MGEVPASAAQEVEQKKHQLGRGHLGNTQGTCRDDWGWFQGGIPWDVRVAALGCEPSWLWWKELQAGGWKDLDSGRARLPVSYLDLDQSFSSPWPQFTPL